MSYHQKGVCYICRQYLILFSFLNGPPTTCADCMGDIQRQQSEQLFLATEEASIAFVNEEIDSNGNQLEIFE